MLSFCVYTIHDMRMTFSKQKYDHRSDTRTERAAALT